METQTMLNKDQIANKFKNSNWEKRTCEMVKLSKITEPLIGIYSHQKSMTITDKTTGELKDVPEFVLINELGEKFSFLGDAGFSSEFHRADVKSGDLVKIVKEGQTDLGNGKRVNNYSIFVA